MAPWIAYAWQRHDTAALEHADRIGRRQRAHRSAASLCGFLACVCLTCLLGLPLRAAATLGEDSTSTASDRAAMDASLQISQTARYHVHELQTPAGTIVRQYVLPTGTVFAITWTGPVLPDLRQTLGRYFDRYAAAVVAMSPGSRQVSVQESDFVVQSTGQMRAFRGKAYLPQALPQDVRAEELQ